MKIALIMPQSPMYRNGGGFATYLRNAPLTLTTLAALIPEELNADINSSMLVLLRQQYPNIYTVQTNFNES